MGNPNNFPGAKKGDRLTAPNVRRWISGASDALARRVEGLASFPRKALAEPAGRAFAINTTGDDIPAGAPVSLEDVPDDDPFALLNQRAFKVVLIEDATADPVNAGVAVDLIPYNGAGEIYVSGVCLARLTDDNADLIAAAGLTTLWEADDEGDRYAVVRFGGAAAAVSSVYIVGGQSLGTYNLVTTYGIVKQTGILSGITTQVYDPGECDPITGAEFLAPSPAITAWPAGLGYGTKFGAAGYQRVMVVNDGRAGTATLLVGSATDNPTRIPSAQEGMIYSTRTGPVTLADGTSITAVIPDFG
jgi:hypothetical protein